jgi:GxxExxY protein
MEKIENTLSKEVVSACFKIQKKPGPGLLESVYEEILCYELTRKDLQFVRQKPVRLIYENVRLDLGFRADIIVENKIIPEVKAIELLAPVHKMQLLTFLKITGLKSGLLVNFNCYDLSGNIKRLVNNL